MNGAGWICDQCRMTSVVPNDSLHSGPPSGWFVLHRTPFASPEGVKRDVWDFCSIECVLDHTRSAVSAVSR